MRVSRFALFATSLAFFVFSGCQTSTAIQGGNPSDGKDAGTGDGRISMKPVDAGMTQVQMMTDGGTTLPAPAPRHIIYQLVVRTFGNTTQAQNVDGTLNQNGVGKFNDINDAALSSLNKFGVTDIWLTGALRQATLTSHADVGISSDDPDIVKGRAGSFFAIRDYFDVSPDYAVNKQNRMQEFDALVSRIHAAGLKVHLDLVPNHVARSYHSLIKPELDFGKDDDRTKFFSKNNNFYYLANQGPLHLSKPAEWQPEGVTFDGRFADEDASSVEKTPKVTGLNIASVSPSAYDWYETIKLNYGVDFSSGLQDFSGTPSTWKKVDAVLEYWQSHGVDGFRCDFAHVVPNEAWKWLIARARERNPKVYFYAEAYAPIDSLKALISSGFDAIYDDPAIDSLKRIYQGKGSQDLFSTQMGALDDEVRSKFLHYLENHDERRVASNIVVSENPDDSGFGGPSANYQLAPLLYLYSNGPVLIFNGQELGEPASGREGYGGDDGRTSIFDYTASPEVQKWVNGHQYDEVKLSPSQVALRNFLAGLNHVSQRPSAVGARYWGLKYFNRPEKFGDCPEGLYSFARFDTEKGVLMLVVANFTPSSDVVGKIRIPKELADAAKLKDNLTVTLLLDKSGAHNDKVTTLSNRALQELGFEVKVPDQSALVFEIQ